MYTAKTSKREINELIWMLIVAHSNSLYVGKMIAIIQLKIDLENCLYHK